MKKIILALAVLAACVSCSAPDYHISNRNWAPEVSTALNDFLDLYEDSDLQEYVVTDFDNTAAIFDVSLQLMAYQLETMSFAMTPDEFASIIPDRVKPAWEYYGSRVDTLCKEYSALYKKYGPFTVDGVSEQTRGTMAADSLWLGFAEGMGTLYQDMASGHNIGNAFIWVMSWFAGMTEPELYELSCRSHSIYKDVPTVERSIGDYTWTEGIGFTENTKELWKTMSSRGIDVWVCSASCTEAVTAAIDVAGLHDYCKGVVAMSLHKDADGRYDGRYDYETGHARLSVPGNGWIEDTLASKTEVLGAGKVVAINNCIRPKYDGRGPLACFGDSTGDFDFCTEYASTKLVICFNRASRKITDGGGLLSEVAVYENDALRYNLQSANAAGDIYYVLQGRNENGTRSLRPSSRTIRLGESEEKLFCNQDNYDQLEQFEREGLSIREIMDGCYSNFEESYPGYRSIPNLEGRVVVNKETGEVAGRYAGVSDEGYMVETQELFELPFGDCKVETWQAADGKGVVYPVKFGFSCVYETPGGDVCGRILYEQGFLPDCYKCLGWSSGWFKISFDGHEAWVPETDFSWDTICTF